MKKIELEIEEFCWLQSLLSDVKNKTPDIGGAVAKHYGTYGVERLTAIYNKHFAHEKEGV